MKNSRVTIHMVASVDGYIAKKDNSIEWFETAHDFEGGQDFASPEEFFKTVDCFVMGANTYELAESLSEKYGWPYGDIPTIVVTHRQFENKRSNVSFYSGNLVQLFEEQLYPKYKNIWLAGGSMLTKELLLLNLADEIRLNVLPIILGNGLPFFDAIGKEIKLELTENKTYKNGMVELCYKLS